MNKDELIKMELKSLIQSNALTIEETRRIMNNREDITDYEQGRTDGIILMGADIQDNLLRFAHRIGIDFKEQNKQEEKEK